MEFFRIIKVKTQEETIQNEFSLENLGLISNELFLLGDQNENTADIGSLWGEFTLIRTQIKGGVRFALMECPNALAWTITTGHSPQSDQVVIHLTINRQEQKESFIEEIEDFLDDQCMCLTAYFTNSATEAK